MAKKNKLELNFQGFLDLAEEIGKMGEGLLLKAVQESAKASKDYVNQEIAKAIDSSKYDFDGSGHSKGETKKSLQEISQMPVETTGTTVTAYAGIDLEKAPQGLILAIEGAPHKGKDTKLSQAVRVKGSIRKEVQKIQSETFYKILEEGRGNG